MNSVSTETADEKEKFSCQYCSKQFSTKNNLKIEQS